VTRFRDGWFGVRILTRPRQFSILQKLSDRLLGTPSLLFSWYRRRTRWYSGRGVMLNKQCHLAPRLGINGAITQIFSYAVMAFTVIFYRWLCHVEQPWTGRCCVNMLKISRKNPEGQIGLFGCQREHYHSAEC